MNPTPSRTHSVAGRLALMSLLGLAVVLLAVSAAIGVIAHRSTHALMVRSVTDQLQSIVTVAEASDKTSRELVLQSYSNSFRNEFEPTPMWNKTTSELLSFGMAINNDFSAVDRYTKNTGGVATVFSREGDDFKRITTSLKKQDGERAMGTLLDRAHPAYARMLNGQTYTGPATLFGKAYMTHYDPIKDSAGAIVGIFFVGTDITLQAAAVEKQIADTKFFQTGGVYYMAVQGAPESAVMQVHPEARGKKVLEAYPGAQVFLTALSSASDGYVRDAVPLLNAAKVDSWAVLRKTSSGAGWFVAEVPEGESMAQYWGDMRIIWTLLAATAVLLGVGLFWLVRRTVSRPLGELTAAVTAVAHGDLTQSFHTARQDEIGTLVNEVEGMRQRYLDILSQVREAVENVGTASSEIASGNQDLSVRTEQTAGNLQRTASSMDQLTGTVKQSADAARQANQLANTAAQVAARGGSAVGEVVSTMNEINQSSRKIADIVGVIDSIAFQTNILALNAAVEAARAGEQGRGFAVVASEVRSLAQRSAEAAREIKTLIGASVEKVESGSRQVQTAGQTMDEIVGSVQRVSDIIGEITAASREQSEGIDEVNGAIGQLDQMTQQNAALVEQSAAAAESLRDQANRLTEAVAVFKLAGPSTPRLSSQGNRQPAPQTVGHTQAKRLS
jgi:methyl-accepting chemotaxis protein